MVLLFLPRDCTDEVPKALMDTLVTQPEGGG